MLPVIFEIPLPGGRTLPIHGYGLMIVVGFLTLTWICSREAQRRGLPRFVFDLGLTMLLTGFLGGRIFYYVEFYDEQFAHLPVTEFFKIWKGGLVFYGGAIGGVVGAVGYIRVRKLPLLPCLDIAAMGCPIGMGFGRLGCFLNGCCYGRPCLADFPLGVRFPVGSPAHHAQQQLGWVGMVGETLPVHAVQLYQAGHDFLLFGLILLYLRRPESPIGVGMPLLFGLYAIGRFGLEGLRADTAPTWTGWSTGQNTSLFLGVVAGLLVAWIYRREARSEARIDDSLKKNPLGS